MVLLFVCFCEIDAYSQIDINMDINEMVINAQRQKTKTSNNGKKQTKQQQRQQKISFPKIDSFTPIDGSMKSEEDYSAEAFGYTWGDPVANPQIRRNTANNLYGQVRYNPDGSKRWHQGFDYFAPVGTPVMSVGDGVIESTGTSDSYGIYVQIKHVRGKNTYYSFYAHLSSKCVKTGQVVKQGTVIGKSGVSGNANNLSGEDEHLHLEYRIVPKSGRGHQANPNAIVKTKFYSADPKNPNQSNVKVVKQTIINGNNTSIHTKGS